MQHYKFVLKLHINSKISFTPNKYTYTAHQYWEKVSKTFQDFCLFLRLSAIMVKWSSYLVKCPLANLYLRLVLSQKPKEWLASKNLACNHTLLNRQYQRFRFVMAEILSDLANSSNAATNDVDGRIGNKTWCKCECSAPMETNIESVCCLEIPKICKPRFSGTLCLHICRSDPHFIPRYSMQKKSINYLISTHIWSLLNQNKSFISIKTSLYFCKHFTLLIMSSLYKRCCFRSIFFSKEQRFDSGGSLLLKSNILFSESSEAAIGWCSESF